MRWWKVYQFAVESVLPNGDGRLDYFQIYGFRHTHIVFYIQHTVCKLMRLLFIWPLLLLLYLLFYYCFCCSRFLVSFHFAPRVSLIGWWDWIVTNTSLCSIYNSTTIWFYRMCKVARSTMGCFPLSHFYRFSWCFSLQSKWIIIIDYANEMIFASALTCFGDRWFCCLLWFYPHIVDATYGNLTINVFFVHFFCAPRLLESPNQKCSFGFSSCDTFRMV